MPDQTLARQDAPDCPSTLGGPPEELALDLTSEAVRLVARGGDGAWSELGAVPLAADGFRAALNALRQRAEADGAHGALPLTIWLPAAQILVRRYVLKRGDRTAEARRRLAEDTGHRADALTVALSPAADGALVTVLGTSRRTVAEAVDYARRWGFRPDRVSTRVEAGRFGTAGPAFALPDPAPGCTRRHARRLLAAAAAALGVGLASWGAYGLLPASGSASLAVIGPGAEPAPAPARIAARPVPPLASPDEGGIAQRREDRTRSGGLPDGRLARAGEATPAGNDPPPLADGTSAPPASGTAAPPPEPLRDAPTGRARGSAVPERRATRPEPTAPETGADAGTLLAGMGRMADDDAGGESSRQATVPGDEIMVAASDVAPLDVPGRPMPRPADRSAAATATPRDQDAEEAVVRTEGPAAPPPATMSNSGLAAVLAPPPPPRPDRPRSGRAAASRTTAPPGVGNAAAQPGLALDATSLIGVMDAKSGRQALLRTSSGDYLKVGRGDEVAGWRVSAIGRDAMRLTRGGESRTLLLVTR